MNFPSLTNKLIRPFDYTSFFFISLKVSRNLYLLGKDIHTPKLSLRRKKIPQRRLTFAEIKEIDQEHPPIQQEDTISEGDFQSAQGASITTEVLPIQVPPITPRVEIVQHTGLTDRNVSYEEYNITKILSMFSSQYSE